MKIVPADANK